LLKYSREMYSEMNPSMARPDKSVRLFENGALERLSHVHPLTPLALWTPVIAWLLWGSFERLETATVVALGTGGLVTWTLAEYALHRFVFHLAPASPARRRLQFVVHGIHHADPDDRTRWLMPPAPAIAAAAILFALFRLILGPAWVQPFFGCFLVGYLAYDYTHFAVHHSNPPTRVGRYLRRQHMLHHFATPDARWGVTSPLWDRVFRTTDERRRSKGRVRAAV
jgi:sterol desaturase/sphingolipid hydroxylase (fatty acid hydroxylase superfamily)